MADHLVTKFWGLCTALTAAILTLALIAPAGAEASGPGYGALSQLSSVVPAPAQAAVVAALAQVPSPPVVQAAPAPPPVAAAPPPPPASPPAARAPAVPAAPAGPAAPAAPAPSPAPAIASQPAPQPAGSISTPTVSVPTVPVRTTGKRPHPPAPARSGSSLGGQASAQRVSRPMGHRTGQRGLRHPSPPMGLSRREPVVSVTDAAFVTHPVPGERASHARVTPVRHVDVRKAARPTRHVGQLRAGRVSAAVTSEVGPPVSANLPPGGAEGSAPGAGGGAAGATAAALLALVGVCILRALLPGLLGLGLAPARSALLVLRLERPG